MTKQEFIAMSLPYGLRCTANGLDKSHRLKGVFEDKYTLSNCADMGYFSPRIKDIKPILHPLPDLTKEIEHKLEKFVPMDVLVYMNKSKMQGFGRQEWKGNPIVIPHYSCMPFWMVQKLIKWHFDIAGLIEKGEAIDVSTLIINPYK